jgi:hypothetical protein
MRRDKHLQFRFGSAFGKPPKCFNHGESAISRDTSNHHSYFQDHIYIRLCFCKCLFSDSNLRSIISPNNARVDRCERIMTSYSFILD